MSEAVHNKIIAITGAASGIGLATAHLLASRGAHLSLADLNAPLLETAAAAIKAASPATQVLTFPLDVRNVSQVDEWISSTVKHFGRLDGAANMAGVIPAKIGSQGVRDQDQADWDLMFGINVTGVMNCLRAELRVIEKGGSIVSASSIAGIRGRAFNASYTASKHAVIGLTASAAREVGPDGTRVNSICPGYIETPMTKKSDEAHAEAGKLDQKEQERTGQVPLRRAGQASEVASLIVFLLGDESKYITGAAYTIDGGYSC